MDNRTQFKAKIIKFLKENLRKYFCDNEVAKIS